jgi:hypothetical protein
MISFIFRFLAVILASGALSRLGAQSVDPTVTPSDSRLSPIIQLQDLVAGNGQSGFDDGPFYAAHFNHPYGLCLNPDSSVLYVADQQNNRVRTVLLDQANRVGTLVGTGAAGRIDGPLTVATFNQPQALAFLPDDRIAVSDNGNALLRLIDLKARVVSTLAGGGPGGQPEGPALAASLGSVWNLAYFPPDGCLYFSEPDQGLLLKLDLKGGQISAVLKNDPRIPNPAALCVAAGNLYVADFKLPSVYQLVPSPAQAAVSLSPTPTPQMDIVGQATNVKALAGGAGFLYAYQGNPAAPLIRLFPNPAPLTFVSIWGEVLRNFIPADMMAPFQNVGWGDPIGFIADPTSEKRFYFSNPQNSTLFSYRDLNQDSLVHSDDTNSMGFHDFEYPVSKPPRTFRILLLGRSYLYFKIEPSFETISGPTQTDLNRMANVAKHMELLLNTFSALRGGTIHYEVFDGGSIQSLQPFDWAYYYGPTIAKKYGIDLVVVMQDAGAGLTGFFTNPPGPEGVPSLSPDPEFILKPNQDKFKSGLAYDLLQMCFKKKKVKENSATQWDVPSYEELIKDPDIRPLIRHLISHPLALLNQKVSAAGKDGEKPKVALCFFPSPSGRYYVTTPDVRSFWAEACREAGIPSLDLCDDFTVLRTTYFPFSELAGMDHFNGNGHWFLSFILADEFIQNGWIPFAPAKRGSLLP